ncbi:hypothetical protein GRF29_213g120619 [Pseudopithomyces chartarum]|uniref:Uncharacterized protein n=1 Tax=Pseudopithomyces chartarum TaxID=1892770 RepID=A0AAN6LM35_9PLEO|nr:hypothetical protein GRF29_213g120619 [Pseudopithomyces chartarum]
MSLINTLHSNQPPNLLRRPNPLHPPHALLLRLQSRHPPHNAHLQHPEAHLLARNALRAFPPHAIPAHGTGARGTFAHRAAAPPPGVEYAVREGGDDDAPVGLLAVGGEEGVLGFSGRIHGGGVDACDSFVAYQLV